ncbi:MAG: LTA synthase family protein [Thiohalomonadales bacterium]
MPKLIRFLLIITILHLFLFSILRVTFWQYFHVPADPLSLADLSKAFYLGLKFDLQLSLLVILPVFVLGNLRILNPFNSGGMRFVWLMYLGLMLTVILLIYLGNFGHYDYLGKPIDATILRFFENPEISIQMVWETYPVFEFAAGFLTFILFYLFILNRLIVRNSHQIEPHRGVFKKIVTATVFTSLVLFGLFGKLSHYPLRWSDAFFSPHNFVPAVASNPVLYFFTTFKNRKLIFSDEDTRKYYGLMAKYLNVDQPDKLVLNYVRTIPAKNTTNRGNQKKQFNVVMVFLESFSAFKSGLYKNPLNPTPNIDALAKKGYFFTRFYTPSTGTARSVFTALTGIPDVEPKKTSTRNPLVVDQNLIMNSFKDYKKLYFLGGSASWGNIRGLLSKNITDLELYEEGKYKSPRVDVWGIADHNLFKEANNVLKKIKKDQPFFAVIQTSGNHRPYTIPGDVPDFTLDNSNDDSKLTNSGFLNNGEYNSYRFLDHSVGLFMKAAKKEAYFDNTLFVFFGDHGVAGTGKHIKPAYSQLGLMNLHVPLIFYAPKLLPKPQQFNKVASEVDLMPTIAGLINLPYVNSTLGRDLLDQQFDNSRYAFTVTHDSKQRIGLISNKFYYQMDESGSNAALHDLNSNTPRNDLSEQYPAIQKNMDRILRAINTSVNYMRYHNSKAQIQQQK